MQWPSVRAHDSLPVHILLLAPSSFAHCGITVQLLLMVSRDIRGVDFVRLNTQKYVQPVGVYKFTILLNFCIPPNITNSSFHHELYATQKQSSEHSAVATAILGEGKTQSSTLFKLNTSITGTDLALLYSSGYSRLSFWLLARRLKVDQALII